MGPCGLKSAVSKWPPYFLRTHRKVFHLIFNLCIDPAHRGIITRTTRLHEVRQIRHAGQFVEPRRGQILRFQHLGYAELTLRQIHGVGAVAHTLTRIQAAPVWKQPRLAVVQQCGQINAAIPICGQIGDLAVRQCSLQPGKHELAWREFAASDLIAHNQGPDEAQYQFHIAIDNIHIANVHQLDVIRFDGFECGGCVLQIMMLIRRPAIPGGLKWPCLQTLDESTQTGAIAEIRRPIMHLEGGKSTSVMRVSVCFVSIIYIYMYRYLSL